MENQRKSRWEGNEHWFKFDRRTGLRRFGEFPSLDSTSTAVALRALKYRLEEEMGLEITDELFSDIFRKVCNFRPVPGLGGFAQLEFIQPLQDILESHGVSKKHLSAIHRVFRVRVENPRYYDNLFLHIPHSSTAFPKGIYYSFNDLNEKERLLIDYYTDELFIPYTKSDHIKRAVFPVCRLCCDVERLVHDPLEKEGLGFLYSWPLCKYKGRMFTSFLTKSESFRLYSYYHAKVSNALVSMNNLLLIDCHSFSNMPNLLNPTPTDIDICIGYNDDETCPNKVVISNMVRHFESFGYKVGINEPFSNSKTFSIPANYHSVLINVNKRLYMNEQTLEKTEGFDMLRNNMQSLYGILLKSL